MKIEMKNLSLELKSGARIKLLGDSITHGVGGTGFCQNGEHIVAEFSRSPEAYCWAKLFAEYMSEKYSVIVVNNACTGTNIEFVINNFDTLVDEADDLVICTIGTNNRHVYMKAGEKPTREVMLSNFSANIAKLREKFLSAGKNFILIANIPASSTNEKDGTDYWRILHMCDINDAYKSAEAEYGFPFISLYDMMSGYCEKNEVSLDSLLGDGLHPNDAGYEVMFELIKSALGV